MAFILTTQELDWAFEAINHHGYSALLPHPEEWSIVQNNWTSFRADLEKLDLDTYHPYPPMRVYAPKSRINLRPVSLLHPQDVIIYTALTLIVKDAVEASRVPTSKKRVFSYRSKSTVPAELYQSDDAYKQYTKRLSEKAVNIPYVAVTDVADFYPRLYQHRLQNIIRAVSPTGSRSVEVARVLVEKSLITLPAQTATGYRSVHRPPGFSVRPC